MEVLLRLEDWRLALLGREGGREGGTEGRRDKNGQEGREGGREGGMANSSSSLSISHLLQHTEYPTLLEMSAVRSFFDLQVRREGGREVEKGVSE